ncbi:MAG TPA: beta-propeller fold lactonase family protein, partial [Acidimicrobiales bacterium]|nr:beta-propeller fold lactonase family protein [Acidimicrobiales bacterium]
HFHEHGHALFVETDASSGNQIVSYRRAPDGTISFAGRYRTNGNGATAAGATADPLASQGGLALINHGAELVATNAGSDTITVFAVEGTHLTYLQQLPSGGQFPVSVAAHGRYLAVLNSGGAGSVEQFRIFGGFVDPHSAQVRTLGLSNTTPPDYLHGAGEVGYTPDGRHLVVTTKASSNSFEVYSVGDHGQLAATPVVTAANNAVPFAFTFDNAGHLVATEASNSSVSVYVVEANGTLSSLGTVSDGAKALCWIATSNGYFFGDNAGSGTVSSFDENVSGAPQLVAATAATAHAGTTDPVVSPDGRFLYVESGGAGTLDGYAIGAGGSLAQIETIYNLPVASEGIAAS